jgi:HD-GYP domain-containing protein (c-di-GMP phosphodiesterase class II)
MDKELHILLLEDVPEDAELVTHELRRGGIAFQAKRVDTRKAFVEELQHFAPDMVLADYTLPTFDGRKALGIVREKSRDIPFIFVAGTIGEEMAIDLLKNGATDYVLKTRLSRLVPAVQRALHESEEVARRRKAEQDLVESIQKLRNAMEGIIQAMAVAIETRDPYTAGHQKRVAQLAGAIATEMHLSEEQINGLRMAASIHDLGKIYVPAEILSKPGGLSDLEFSIIKIHPEAGYNILKMIEFPWPVAKIAFQHQERYNGSGYPMGLEGKDIMLEARILAVADVVEAMTVRRPYREAIGEEKALEEIQKNRGILYDPDVVDACLRLFREKRFKFD